MAVHPIPFWAGGQKAMTGRGNCGIPGGLNPVPEWMASPMNRGERYFVGVVNGGAHLDY